ncbi:MAG: hypothetical protein A3B25_02695 [Candidatus Ryanbacteria bacterium RIFCSPLOWO2_01_FULL_48_26]|uniref:Uncharacterized protein n=1 Tax=Candidatus Ryanbacteria bacterium RIFCSPLOWO2_01_FULL_48_26 TaxID=1802126 RepID=A0A1G2GSL6_9BACT|nr:MAG: hypothetical protein A3B25_02695 [Candidatus Ryanbacteria bacterium RIFCSPLOWO2_01_FULL_48_26]
MKNRTRILFFAVLMVAAALPASADGACDRSVFTETIFHFPNEEQRGNYLLINAEWAKWLKEHGTSDVSVGEQLSSLTVFQNRDGQVCVKRVAAQIGEQSETAQIQPRTSKIRRGLSVTLMALPLALSFVNPYAGLIGGFGAPFLLRSGSASNGPKSATKKTDSTFRLEGEWWKELW